MAGRGIERTGSFGRQNEQLPRTRLAGWSDNRRLFEHDVSVRAADAEGADARPTRNPAPFPIAQRVVHVERAVGEIDFRIGLPEVQARRQLLMLEGENRLDQTGDTRGRVEMA